MMSEPFAFAEFAFVATAVIMLASGPAVGREPSSVERVLRLPPGQGNPRNSSPKLCRLKDGRILLIYAHFTGGEGDHAAAHLVSRYSDDEGRTWSRKDRLVVEREGGMNVACPSVIRLDDDRLALFNLRKNSLADCRPFVRFSMDEGKSWSEPRPCVPEEEKGYYVLNNDRAVQLESGRIVLPLAQHNGPDWKKWTKHGVLVCYYSDDEGQSWQRGTTELDGSREGEKRLMVQEPGVVELTDGRLMMFCRTDGGYQYMSFSEDEGDHWTPLERSPLVSPRSPASIKRIPSTGDLLAVWNNHENIDASLQGKRTPLTVAISQDEGKTWIHKQNIEDSPHGWYCYTAILFQEDHVLLAHTASDRRTTFKLGTLQVTRVPLSFLYEDEKD